MAKVNFRNLRIDRYRMPGAFVKEAAANYASSMTAENQTTGIVEAHTGESDSPCIGALGIVDCYLDDGVMEIDNNAIKTTSTIC